MFMVFLFGALQLREIEKLFRRQFILLKKQLEVQDKLDVEKQRSDQVIEYCILMNTIVVG